MTMPDQFVYFRGRTDNSILFCQLIFWCINTLDSTQLCIYDHASITIFTVIFGGHCRLIHGNVYPGEKNLMLCIFKNNMNIHKIKYTGRYTGSYLLSLKNDHFNSIWALRPITVFIIREITRAVIPHKPQKRPITSSIITMTHKGLDISRNNQ